MFDNVSISVLLGNFSSHSFSPKTGVLQGSVLRLHLYSIYINSLPALLCSVASPLTSTHVPSSSPSSLDAYQSLLAPPDVNGYQHAVSSMPINTLLFADDVAIFGSAHDVQAMLHLAAQHSFTLDLSLYDEILPAVEEFIYLGVLFCNKGIHEPSIVTHHRSGVLATMAMLNAVGVCWSGFSLLLSSRLYRTFIRPKFEYGLAILPLKRTDTIQLEKIQDKCLCIIVGGHQTSSTTFCIRAHYLPSGCLLSLLHHHYSQSSSLVTLCHNTLLQSIPIDLNVHSSKALKRHFETFQQFKTDELRLSSNQVLFLACRPLLEVDPILFLPATRVERSRLVCWRMGWLPGTPKDCPCGTDHTSRRHLAVCSLVPAHLLACLPIPSNQNCNPIDFAITALPNSSQAPCPSYWVALLTIL
ncbi:hypothetical protein PHYBLDRAFT_141942 [Phycomyces blakesleeanus NRRL 1555(-)]|uniref:Reverse transcriptase domain-containing protein n=1 Tax=Phycomyces blakesleeanus (strain ATCC 8743b / DSM 1359 / FGSC 10004 / NBRC 33097 / NRRL 1555) TaxID=763407 RepID=A0A167PJK5_PHYB8|nr:hypothetical protein PHYBLDRAFT_141942 [Phycomyces blakesleeanus NRRL 1555(-)]OAD78079.1 hypothetical protein PHYBLDRAFT_141942 [Phycomyces blakesleeanus NRRL 1555(-)]|eukprot:XP_018296119.1 hypothetical protein PHYBLDRAFT_141942 [Phycomyces blakesleeanus NRRL 1555(-)]